MTSNKGDLPDQPLPRQSAPMSQARYRLLCSVLTNYAFGLIALVVAPTLIPVRQSPVWITFGEIGLAMIFLALALLIAPRGEELRSCSCRGKMRFWDSRRSKVTNNQRLDD